MNENRVENGIFLVRISLGVMFVAHALLKLLLFTLPGTAAFFASLGLPGAVGYLVFIAELLGGLALIAGFYTRYVAIALFPVLLGATWVHLTNGWVFSAEGGGWEYPFFLAVCSIAIYLTGPGSYAITEEAAKT